MTRFADVTSTSGVAFEYRTDGFEGGGLAVVDLDGDELPDIVAGRRDGGLTLFRTHAALRFEQLGDRLDAQAAASSIGVADLDNDGDPDLIVAGAGVSRVLENQGDLHFREVVRFDDSGPTEHILPVDLDGDGRLDLYFSNYDQVDASRTQNRLYMNRGGSQFAFAGIVGTGLSWTATALDVDADGDQDLYVANDTLLADFGKPAPPPAAVYPPDLVLRNDGPGLDGVPRFTDIAAELGLAKPRSSMGGVVGDFDDDGRVDLYVPDFGAKKVFLRDPAGGFVESATQLGLTAITRLNATCDPTTTSESCLVLSWSAALSDFDLDGYDELLIVNGETVPELPPPVLLFSRDKPGAFSEVAPNIPCMDARGLVVTDLDGDGDQDVVIGQKDGPLLVYENRGRPVAGTWLRIALRGAASNRDGVGAVVTLRMASGRTQTRVVGAGGVIHTASPAEAFFGLGGDEVEAVEVAWPSGRRSGVTRPSTGALVLEEGP